MLVYFGIFSGSKFHSTDSEDISSIIYHDIIYVGIDIGPILMYGGYWICPLWLDMSWYKYFIDMNYTNKWWICPLWLDMPGVNHFIDMTHTDVRWICPLWFLCLDLTILWIWLILWICPLWSDKPRIHNCEDMPRVDAWWITGYVLYGLISLGSTTVRICLMSMYSCWNGKWIWNKI